MANAAEGLSVWETVYYYFDRFKRDSTWQKIHHTLPARLPVESERNRQLSAAIVDSRSVKTTGKGGYGGTTRAKRSTGGSDSCRRRC